MNGQRRENGLMNIENGDGVERIKGEWEDREVEWMGGRREEEI